MGEAKRLVPPRDRAGCLVRSHAAPQTFLHAYFLAGFSFLVSFDSFELESFESLLADSFVVESFEPESLESFLSDEVSLFPGSPAGFLPA